MANESMLNLLLGGLYPTQPPTQNYPPPQIDFFGYDFQNYASQPNQNLNQTVYPSTPTTPSTPLTPETTGAIPESEPEVAFVLETQPEQPFDEETIQCRRQSKKRAIPHPEETFLTGTIRWKKPETVCLVDSFLVVSEDEIVGNKQHADDFWFRILRRFHERMGKGIYCN